jgi:hypothetical protein
MRGSVGGKQYVIARGSQILPSADLFRPPIAPIYVLLASEEPSLISGPAIPATGGLGRIRNLEFRIWNLEGDGVLSHGGTCLPL